MSFYRVGNRKEVGRYSFQRVWLFSDACELILKTKCSVKRRFRSNARFYRYVIVQNQGGNDMRNKLFALRQPDEILRLYGQKPKPLS